MGKGDKGEEREKSQNVLVEKKNNCRGMKEELEEMETERERGKEKKKKEKCQLLRNERK